MDSDSPILQVNNIEVVYNQTIQVLRGLSLTVPKGQIVALLGSNGAGKSTTLKAISNLLALQDGHMTRGNIRFMGQDTKSLEPHALVRAGLFHVLEGRHVFEDLTVEENLTAATYALTQRSFQKTDFDLIYEYFPKLYERRKGLAGYLSGGEQQMLAIGRALVAQPQLILLDEPSLGLSPVLVETAHYGYILETGKVVIDNTAEKLAADPDVREFYLGVGSEGGAKGFKNLKHYKRRKRWLS
jgi:branched-chain amino acid transport system ATP-binding protein